jgi:redox-sensing transcriptional repressor
MGIEGHKSVPEPTLRRLPLYHRYLRKLAESGRETVSCTDVAQELRLDATQIRKDFEAAGIEGRPRVGYILVDLIDGIEQFLGWKNVQETVLVGVGNLGSALLGYHKFAQCGLNIVAAFDADPAKIGTEVHGKQVFAIKELASVARQRGVLIGIITVPGPGAQVVADLMVHGGIRAIWNFAPIQLRVPEQIIVHNEDLYCSLASLCQKLAKALRAYPAPLPLRAAHTGPANLSRSSYTSSI